MYSIERGRPAKYVPNALDETGEKGTKVATIVTARFSEVGNVEIEFSTGKVIVYVTITVLFNLKNLGLKE